MSNIREKNTFKIFLVDDKYYNKLDADIVIVGRLNSITNCGIYVLQEILNILRSKI